jgi:hypothetical protein
MRIHAAPDPWHFFILFLNHGYNTVFTPSYLDRSMWASASFAPPTLWAPPSVLPGVVAPTEAAPAPAVEIIFRIRHIFKLKIFYSISIHYFFSLHNLAMFHTFPVFLSVLWIRFGVNADLGSGSSFFFAMRIRIRIRSREPNKPMRIHVNADRDPDPGQTLKFPPLLFFHRKLLHSNIFFYLVL